VSEPTWRTIPGMWAAYAVDGRGHRRVDGSDGLYDVLLPVDLFENASGGMARLVEVPGGKVEIFTLPREFLATHLKVRLQVSGVAGGARMILVTGLQTCGGPYQHLIVIHRRAARASSECMGPEQAGTRQKFNRDLNLSCLPIILPIQLLYFFSHCIQLYCSFTVQ
jgi:hypothetical protein